MYAENIWHISKTKSSDEDYDICSVRSNNQFYFSALLNRLVLNNYQMIREMRRPYRTVPSSAGIRRIQLADHADSVFSPGRA